MITGAAPYDHDERFHGYQLYEGLTRQVGSIRHGPSGTTWVYAYRGVSPRGEPVMVFRPAPWLQDLTGNGPLIQDLARHRVDSGLDWAAIAAPPGVRLRALVLALSARGNRLSDPIVHDLIARTRDALALGRNGDCFVTWDGGVWLAPSFPESWDHEIPSLDGDEIFDPLTLDSSYALLDVLTGQLPSLGSVRVAASPPPPPLAAFGVRQSPLTGEAFFAEVAQLERPAVEPGALAHIAAELFPDTYERQASALRRG